MTRVPGIHSDEIFLIHREEDEFPACVLECFSLNDNNTGISVIKEFDYRLQISRNGMSF